MQRQLILAVASSLACCLNAYSKAEYFLNNHSAPIAFVTSDGTALFALDQTDMHWWKIATGEKQSLELTGPGWLALSGDGKFIASAGQLMASNYYWNANQKKYFPSTVFLLESHQEDVTGAAFSADGKVLATASGKGQRAGEVRIWDIDARKERLPRVEYAAATFFPRGGADDLFGGPANLRKPPGVQALALSAEGDKLATVYVSTLFKELGYGTAKVWDTKTGKDIAQIVARGWSIHALAFAADGKTLGLALGKKDEGEIWLCDLTAAKVDKVLNRAAPATCIAFAANGNRMAVAFADGFVKIWDLAKQQERALPELAAKVEQARHLTFTTDGRTLMAGGGRKTGWIKVVNLK